MRWHLRRYDLLGSRPDGEFGEEYTRERRQEPARIRDTADIARQNTQAIWSGSRRRAKIAFGVREAGSGANGTK